jgi:hypothetical protein
MCCEFSDAIKCHIPGLHNVATETNVLRITASDKFVG